MRQSFLGLAFALAVILLAGAPCVATAADMAGDEHVFKLASGGEIRGKLLNGDERPRSKFIVETSTGGLLTLAKDDVLDLIRTPARQVEYEKLRPTYPDTVAGQLALADWCKQNNLPQARQTHLQRVVQLDSQHEAAHKALGHRLYEGKWMTQEQYMHDVVGKIFLPSVGWVTSQEAELRNERHTRDIAEKEQMRIVQRLCSLLDSKDAKVRKSAEQDLLKIRSPDAVKALGYYLAYYKDRKRDHPSMRLLLVKALSKLPAGGAVELVIDAAVTDPHEDVRWEAIQILVETKDGDAPKVMAVRRFIERLRDNSNEFINRAGYALGYMNDRSAIGPLIESITSTHIRTESHGGDATSTTFSSSGSVFGKGPKVKTTVTTYRNQRVLEALQKLANHEFGYNVDQWRAWYATQKRVAPQDVRREK